MQYKEFYSHLFMITEGQEHNLALEYLSDLVKNGPYKGKVYLAGGAVRDMEMGRDPKDLDVVVTGGLNAGIEFATWATKEIGNHKEGSNPVTFPRFGTAKFTLSGVIYKGSDLSNIDVEAVATRKEKYSDGSRKPEVSAGDLSDDVYRRDFTINSLLKDLSTGEILDLTGLGREDIKNGIVRTPLNPDIIFSEDPLRLLRAIRFAIKYEWKLPFDMIRGMKRNASKLNNISTERIREELDKMLLTTNPHKAIKLMKSVGMLQYVIPELVPAIKMVQNQHHSEDVFSHILTVLSKTKPNLINRLGALFHDIGKTRTKTVINNEIHFYSHEDIGSDMARNIMTRLKYPSNIIEPVTLAVKNHMRLKQAGKEGENISDKSLRRLSVDLGDHLQSTLDIIDADNRSHSSDSSMPDQIPNIIKRLDLLKNTIPKKNDKTPVTGDDLKQMGLSPGPMYKQLLDLVKDKQLENPNTTKDEYIELIKNHIKQSTISKADQI